LPLFFPSHPIWLEAAPALDLSTGSISVNPVRSLAALPALVSPVLVFLTTLLLCQSAQAAKRVWVFLSLVGVAIVITSIILEVFFPELQFFTTYKVGFGSFSGVFVNRNVSAAFFGLTAFSLTGTLYLMQSGSRKKHRSSVDIAKQSLVGLILFVVIIAIIATRSRAGTLLSLPILFLCLAAIFAKPPRKQRLTRTLPILGSGLILLVLFGEPVFSRLGNTSQDLRWCVWAGTITGVLDNFWVGTGFGTFKEAFPTYRNPECLGTSAGWHRAHNSFLEFTFGFGVPAALLALAIGYALLLNASLTGLRHRKSLRAIPILMLGALSFVSAHSLVDFPLQIPGVAYYCAALMGAGSAISLLKRQKR
jgi:O-antigen ligase